MRILSIMRFRVALDLDGVLAETLAGFCKLYNKRHNGNLSLEKIKDWYFFFKKLGLSEESFLSYLDEVWSRWRDIPSTDPNITSYLEEITRSYPIIFDIVTCRSKKTITFVKKWLEKYRIPYNSIIVAQDSSEKLNLGYDIYIDDHPDLMRMISSNEGQSVAIFYIRPWNSSLPPMRNVFTAKNWAQISRIMKNRISNLLSE